jgi:hypothetical protein
MPYLIIGEENNIRIAWGVYPWRKIDDTTYIGYKRPADQLQRIHNEPECSQVNGYFYDEVSRVFTQYGAKQEAHHNTFDEEVTIA